MNNKLENCFSLTWISIMIVQKFQRKLWILIFVDSQTHISTKLQVLFLLLGNFLVVVFFRWDYCPFVFLATVSWQSEISRNCYCFVVLLIFQTVLISRYRFELLHHKVSLKGNSHKGVLRWKSLDFFRCIRVLIVQNFQKDLLSKTFFDI